MKVFRIFKRQTKRKHALQALLIALSFTSALEAVHLQTIVAGFVTNAQIYISILKFRGWLTKHSNLLFLGEKARRLVSFSRFNIAPAKSEISKQSHHNLLLIRTLFLCLLHLKLEEITDIRKQKYYDTKFIPDLTIVTRTLTLLIEVDTGKQGISTVAAKINGLLASPKADTSSVLIYFTDSQTTYHHFTQNFNTSTVQFIHLQSQTLAQDLLNLTAPDTQERTQDKENTDIYNDNFATEQEIRFAAPASCDTPSSGFKFNQSINSAKENGQQQPFDSPIDNRTTKTRSQTGNQQVPFQSVQLTSSPANKLVKKATIPLAPNVFVYDQSLATKMQEPWSKEYKLALQNLKIQYDNYNLQASDEDTLADALRLLQIDGLTQTEDDDQEESDND